MKIKTREQKREKIGQEGIRNTLSYKILPEYKYN